MDKKDILIWGNTIFTKKIAQTVLESNKYNISVVTNKTKNNPVLDFSAENNLETFCFDKLKDKEFEVLNAKNFDLSVVIAYGKIIPQRFLDIPHNGSINIHGSLLPSLRGATPIQTAILKGWEKTGVTIQKMVYQMDAGDILKQYEVEIEDLDNFETLREKMIELTTEDFINFLDKYFADAVKPVRQNDEEATFCKISDFSRENGKINWQNSAQNIHNKIRAFYPEPVAWSNFNNKILNFISTQTTYTKSNSEAGTMFFENKKLYVSTHDNDLEILELVLEGKKKMSGSDFGNGIVRKDKIKLS